MKKLDKKLSNNRPRESDFNETEDIHHVIVTAACDKRCLKWGFARLFIIEYKLNYLIELEEERFGNAGNFCRSEKCTIPSDVKKKVFF